MVLTRNGLQREPREPQIHLPEAILKPCKNSGGLRRGASPPRGPLGFLQNRTQKQGSPPEWTPKSPWVLIIFRGSEVHESTQWCRRSTSPPNRAPQQTSPEGPPPPKCSRAVWGSPSPPNDAKSRIQHSGCQTHCRGVRGESKEALQTRSRKPLWAVGVHGGLGPPKPIHAFHKQGC